MSSRKQKSITIDTRITKSNRPTITPQQQPSPMTHNLLHCEQFQQQFVKIKNGQLHEKIIRMTQEIRELEDSKGVLLDLNQKYVSIINEYYHPKEIPKNMGKTCRRDSSNEPRNNHNQLFKQLERDHRNLARHCRNMQSEIKNYVCEMAKFTTMKGHLKEVNHTSAKELIEEVRQLKLDNKLLKGENNRIAYEYEKAKAEANKLMRSSQQQSGNAEQISNELARYQRLVNSVVQEGQDKDQLQSAKIYELEIKVYKLQRELRGDQQWMQQNYQHRRKMQLRGVEFVYETDHLRRDIAELLTMGGCRTSSCGKIKGRSNSGSKNMNSSFCH